MNPSPSSIWQISFDQTPTKKEKGKEKTVASANPISKMDMVAEVPLFICVDSF